MIKKKAKVGMYGETPQVKVGRFIISQGSDKEGDTTIWIQDGEEEGGNFNGDSFESYVEEFFNKHF
jgi:hypothetical protein